MDKKQASQKLDEIVGRAIQDEEYRQRLIDNPQAALEEEGLTQAELDQVAGGALRFTHEGIQQVASAFRLTGHVSAHDLSGMLHHQVGDIWAKVNKPH